MYSYTWASAFVYVYQNEEIYACKERERESGYACV